MDFPKSFIHVWMGFSLINHQFWVPPFQKTPVCLIFGTSSRSLSISILWPSPLWPTECQTLEYLAGGLHFTFQFHQWQVINFSWATNRSPMGWLVKNSLIFPKVVSCNIFNGFSPHYCFTPYSKLVSSSCKILEKHDKSNVRKNTLPKFLWIKTMAPSGKHQKCGTWLFIPNKYA